MEHLTIQHSRSKSYLTRIQNLMLEIPDTLFRRDYRWGNAYRLIGTEFLLFVCGNGCHWAMIDTDLKEPIVFNAKFEEVLDRSPKTIQEELLFHLDIFT